MMTHVPVLAREAIDALAIKPDGVYVDGTFGRGGHSGLILKQLSPAGKLIAMDRDPAAIEAGRQIDDPRLSLVRAPFSRMDEALDGLAAGKVDGILLDIGVSSPQLDEAERGFSFRMDGPLDMRMDPDAGLSAAEWLARVSEVELADVLYNYGDEKHSRRIARAIVARRIEEPFTRTVELADFIASVLPRSHDGIHPATRAFQAIRIAINSELRAIERGMDAAHVLLAAQGRLVTISFHSLEDRLVKQFIAQHARAPQGSRRLPPTASAALTLRDLGKQRASDEEVAANPRSRSAVMRVAERLA